MPIHLPPVSRRSFLHGLAVGGASLAWPGLRAAAAEEQAPYIALLSDVHIAADPTKVVHKEAFNMTENLRAAVADILAQPTPPATVAVLGDLAFNQGLPGDYAQFLKLIDPLRERGLSVHLTMGNHDEREPIKDALKSRAETGVEGRFATVFESLGVRLVMLDSLIKIGHVEGELGEVQRDWLKKTLDERPDATTVVMLHHDPSPTLDPPAKGRLQDTKALYEILEPRKQVKALVFGHSHVWSLKKREDLHLVNLPAVAYHFATPQPLGWCRLEPGRDGGGATIEPRCVAGDRTLHGRRFDLPWRGA